MNTRLLKSCTAVILALGLSACAGESEPNKHQTTAAQAQTPVRVAPPTDSPEVAPKLDWSEPKGLSPDLVVSGSPADMGSAVGKHFKDTIQDVVTNYVHKLAGANLQQLYLAAAGYAQGIPQPYIEEMQALAKAAEVAYEDILLGNVIVEILQLNACSVAVIDPSRSASGGMLFARNLDFIDLGLLHKTTTLIEYRPTGKRAFVNICTPGMVGAYTGINDAQLMAASLMEPSNNGRPGMGALPYLFMMRKILEECGSAEEAATLARNAKRTTANSIAVADGEGGALIIEGTIDRLEVRSLADGSVCATNTFIANNPEGVTRPECPRYATLQKELEGFGDRKISAREAFGLLDKVVQPTSTIQSMVYDSGTRQLLLASWKVPSSKEEPRIYAITPGR